MFTCGTCDSHIQTYARKFRGCLRHINIKLSLDDSQLRPRTGHTPRMLCRSARTEEYIPIPTRCKTRAANNDISHPT